MLPMPVFSYGLSGQSPKHCNAETEDDDLLIGQTGDSDLLLDDTVGPSLDFRQPKRTYLIVGTAKKLFYSASKKVLKFVFGRWQAALIVLISYIALTVGLVCIAVTGKYHNFKMDISLNSFLVPNIKVSRELSAFNAAKAQGSSKPDASSFDSLIKGETCPKNNIDYVPEHLPRRRRDTLPGRRDTSPRRRRRRSDGSFWQSKLKYTLDLVYVAKGSHEDLNIFTKERLQAIHGIEKKLMKHPGYKEHCYISRKFKDDVALKQYGMCTPLNSLTAFFFRSQSDGHFWPDGQGEEIESISDTLNFLNSRPYFFSYVAEDYANNYSKTLRAQLLFGTPFKGIRFGRSQNNEFKRYVRTFVEPLEKINSVNDKVQVLYGGGDLFDYLVEQALYSDLHLASISLVLIALLLLILTFSLWLTFMAILSILSSIGVAYFFYHVVFGIEFMGILNGVSLFVIIGIGVDDIFVFINTFRQAVDNEDIGDRIYHTISVAGKATLFTSFTTAAAFAANALSPIPAIHDFGVFMAILVASCWLSVLFMMSPALCLWNAGIEKLESTLYHKVLSLVGFRRSQRLRLPDDIRQFLSGNRTSGNLGLGSEHVELQSLLNNQEDVDNDDDDEPLLILDDESPAVPEQSTDSLGFRLQSILYHFVAVPVIKARAVILVLYIVVFALSVFLLTRLKVSTEQPNFFKKGSNLQMWTELPDVNLLHTSKAILKDVDKLVINSPPVSTRPTIHPKRRTTLSPPTTPSFEGTQASSSTSTPAFTTLRVVSGKSTQPPVTRRTESTFTQEITTQTTFPVTTESQQETTFPTTSTFAGPTTLQTDRKTTEHLATHYSATMDDNGVLSKYQNTTRERPKTVSPCSRKNCGNYGKCILKNGSATCHCYWPYTGETCSKYCPVHTMAGNCCSIPFIYKGVQQSGCLLDKSKKKSWCSPTRDYDKDRIMEYCNTTVESQYQIRTFTPNKTFCYFPFIFKNVQYYYCITRKGQPETDKWCGIQQHVATDSDLVKCDIRPPELPDRLCAKRSCKRIDKPPDERTALVYLVFGIKGIDEKSVDRQHVLDNSQGEVVYHENFWLDVSCDAKKMIKSAVKICKKFAENGRLVKKNGADCFPKEIRQILRKTFPKLPEPKPDNSKSVIGLKNGTKLTWFAMAFQSTTGKLSSYSSQQRDYYEWEKFLKEVLSDNDIPGSLKNGFQTSETWVKMFSGRIVVDSAVYGIVVSLALCLAAVVIFTGNALLFLILFLTIIGVLLTVTGIFYLTGWQLGGVEAVSLSILVGTSVDYCFHLVEGYTLAGRAVGPSLDAKKSRQWRAKAAVSHIGMSIISSAITTILAAIPLSLTQIQLFAKFGLIVTINTGMSLLYTMTVTMAMLSSFGPARFVARVKACLIGLLVVAGLAGVGVGVMYLMSTKGGYCIPSPQGTPLFHC